MFKLIVSILAASSFSAAQAAEVSMTGDDAFLKASRVLIELGALPTFRDKELLIIKSDPKQVTNTMAAADCGSMFGIPYTKDTRVKVAAVYQITITPIGDKSVVNVKITMDGYMDVNEGAPFFVNKLQDKSTKMLTCSSKGILEAEFLSKLNS